MSTPKPAINDQFWFDESKKMVDSGSEAKNKSANTLQTTIAWLWGVYTASASVGLGLSDAGYSFITLCIISSPSPVLIIGYYLSVWAQMPIDISFDPRSPREIMEVYSRGTKEKSRRLNFAFSALGVAAMLVAVAIVASSIGRPSSSNNFNVVHYKVASTNVISLDGEIKTKNSVLIHVTCIDTSQVLSSVFVKVKPSDSGEIQGDLETNCLSNKYHISVEWKDGDSVTRSIKQEYFALSK